ncbi:MAG TPA: hypothetical protein ENL43_04075 [candidate division WOR-3 bacterium]|uniref:DUF11 domain-containing protein n=1 Tax=candidate division WOR-3 bacterium TaxID=2052148 RepID=A0A7V5HNJ4_UNCW3|nr:MAG: hypothetical protein DRH15_08300 [Deltaproteobacteria bacterium]HHF53522.1 hypothetical protein [candidate division WOR-3 bacterium]
MKRAVPINLICVFCVMLSLSFLFPFFAQGQENQNVVKLSYLPLENSSNGKTFTMKAKLKAENTGSEPIYDVKATVASVNNITINVREVSLGDISPRETVVSSESFEILFEDSLSQEAPQTEIVWEVQCINVNGNLVVEEVSFK